MTNTTGRMDALKTLYKQVILEHSRHPRNYGDLTGATHTEGGHNPSCGDQLQLQLKLEGDHLQAVQFTAKGCAISTASASLMTQAVKGRTPAEALDLAERFRQMLRTGEAHADLGDLAALQGVSALATRTKCASLPWQTLEVMLKGEGRATTED